MRSGRRPSCISTLLVLNIIQGPFANAIRQGKEKAKSPKSQEVNMFLSCAYYHDLSCSKSGEISKKKVRKREGREKGKRKKRIEGKGR